MAHFTYDFDELPMYENYSVYAYGSAVITYSWEGPDPDVGYRGGPYDIEVESITVGPEPMPKNHPLYEAIESYLQWSDHVAQACVDDHES